MISAPRGIRRVKERAASPAHAHVRRRSRGRNWHFAHDDLREAQRTRNRAATLRPEEVVASARTVGTQDHRFRLVAAALRLPPYPLRVAYFLPNGL